MPVTKDDALALARATIERLHAKHLPGCACVKGTLDVVRDALAATPAPLTLATLPHFHGEMKGCARCGEISIEGEPYQTMGGEDCEIHHCLSCDAVYLWSERP